MDTKSVYFLYDLEKEFDKFALLESLLEVYVSLNELSEDVSHYKDYFEERWKKGNIKISILGEHFEINLWISNKNKTYLVISSIFKQEKQDIITKLLYKFIDKLYPFVKKRGTGFLLDEVSDFPEVPDFLDLIYGFDMILYSDIWSVNLFSKEEVKKYGKAYLLNAPCEQREELEDGAILMLINKDSFASTYEQRKKLREYLQKGK